MTPADSRLFMETCLLWNDPYPVPRVDEIALDRWRMIHVVREDVLDVGSKARFLDYMIGHYEPFTNIKEWVFGSCPAHGAAQVSLPYVCGKYDKKAVLFMAKRDPSRWTEYQKLGDKHGAEYNWVPDGMLNVTQARAREYAALSPDTRMVLPIGLEHPLVIGAIVKTAVERIQIVPKRFWTVGSSGTLNRGLQIAWPKAEAHVIQVGHKMKPREVGRAKVWECQLPFNKPAKIMPPFPSAPNYDAKAWSFLLEHAQDGDLFYNVMS